MLVLCKSPYVKTPTGVTRLDAVRFRDARLAMTPFPCGKCLHCRINQARIWTSRLLIEQRLHNESSFLTLTYDDENLPDNGQLDKKHLQNFMKLLRKKVNPDRIRFFGVGEYGAKTFRPHYHLALFGIGRENENFEKAWKKGFVYPGDLNVQSARYITGYITEKLNKEEPDFEVPEFMTCSRKPGIGAGFVKGVKNEFSAGKLINEVRIDGKKMPVGRYLKTKLGEECDVDEYEFDKQFYDYSFKEMEGIDESKVYYDEILKKSAQKRLNQEKKYKIFKKGRTL